MKSILDKSTRDEIIQRINSLNENSTRHWGKMNLYQMLKHCTLSEEHNLGKTNYKQLFIGRLFGKMALKGLLKDETPVKRNTSTASVFKNIDPNGNIASEKLKWISLTEEYANYSKNDFVHIFFGKMTKEQVGYFVYKHSDNHLRQFGV